MKMQLLLSKVSSHINIAGDIEFTEEFPYTNDLVKLGIIKHVGHGKYVLNLFCFIRHLLRELGIKNPELHKHQGVFYHIENITSTSSMGFYFVNPAYSSKSDIGFFLEFLQGAINEHIRAVYAHVPFVFMSEKLRNILEKHDKAVRVLSKLYLDNLSIFSFPIMLPYPEIVKIPSRKRKLNLFAKLEKSIIEAKEILKREQKDFADEYMLALEYRKRFWSKFIVSFAQLDDILKRYALVRMRKKWKSPSKWFEEIMKLLLIDVFVKNKFNRMVEEFLVNYKTGGRKADILIPIKKSDKEATLWVIDTKHWEKDYCKSVEKGYENIKKYIAYIDKNNRKSRLLWELIRLLKNMGIRKVRFQLVFIQRKSKSCSLNIPELKEYYEKIVVLGLKNISDILQHKHCNSLI